MESVHKVVLSTGKEVMLKEMKIKYQNLAVKAIGNKAGDNQLYMGSLMQEELLKMLVVEINGKKPEPKIMENLDEVFSFQEYRQLLSVVGKIMGGNEPGEAQIEIVPGGSN